MLFAYLGWNTVGMLAEAAQRALVAAESEEEMRPKPPENPVYSCQWQERRCREESTHWHPMFGELCPAHAAKIMMTMPGKVLRLPDTIKLNTK